MSEASFHYCNKCGRLVQPQDLAARRAIQLPAGEVLCAQCVPRGAARAAPPPGHGEPATTSRARRPAAPVKPPATGGVPGPSTRTDPAVPPGVRDESWRGSARSESQTGSGKLRVVLGAAVGAVILLGAAWYFFIYRAQEPSVPASPTEETAATPLKQGPSPAKNAARAASRTPKTGTAKPVPGVPVAPAEPASAGATPRDPEPLPAPTAWETAVNLLALADANHDAVAGGWRAEQGALISDDAPSARLALPYEPPLEYDYRVTFRPGGSGSVSLLLAHGGKSFAWTMGAAGNTVCGLELVGGGSCTSRANKSASQAKRFLDPKAEHVALVRVRKTGVRAYLDGRLLTAYDTDFHELDMPLELALPPWGAPRLGIATLQGTARFVGAGVLEVGAKGKCVPRVPTLQAVEAESAQPPPVKVDVKVEYAKVLDAVLRLLAQQRQDDVPACLAEAQRRDEMEPLRPALTLDAELARGVVEVRDAEAAGAAVLKDGRPFVLEKGAEKIAVGGASKNKVLACDDGVLQVRMPTQGNDLPVSFKLADLTPATRLELAGLGLPPGPDATLKRAVVGAVFLRQEGSGLTAAALQPLLDAAAKEQAGAGKLARVRAWIERAQQERAAEDGLGAVERLLAGGKPAEATAAWAKLRDEFAGTATVETQRPEYNALLREPGPQPGLWGSYWSPKDQELPFGKVVAAEAVTALKQSAEAHWPAANVPKQFALRLGGKLLATTEGRYVFQAAAVSNVVCMWVDGILALQASRVPAKGQPVDGMPCPLTRGLHAVRLDYVHSDGPPALHVTWQAPGAKEPQEVPAAILWHDPAQKEHYQKE